jgi:hypothetical protein
MLEISHADKESGVILRGFPFAAVAGCKITALPLPFQNVKKMAEIRLISLIAG